MNNEIMTRLGSFVGVLNNIEVKGKQNLMNLAGVIMGLEEICAILADAEREKEKPPMRENGGDS